MTNAEIIAAAMEANGITEQAHTYNRWKRMGFMVKRGEHAAFRAKIWQKSKKVQMPKEEQEEGETPEEKKFQRGWYLQTACFFVASQVEPIE